MAASVSETGVIGVGSQDEYARPRQYTAKTGPRKMEALLSGTRILPVRNPETGVLPVSA